MQQRNIAALAEIDGFGRCRRSKGSAPHRRESVDDLYPVFRLKANRSNDYFIDRKQQKNENFPAPPRSAAPRDRDTIPSRG
jgi:hypothetical protein